MKKTRFTLLILCLTGAALRAEEVRFAEIKITGGDTLRDVVLLAAEPDGLRLQHRDGACRVKFERLPREVQEQFHYDPEAAVKYATARTKERAELDAKLQEEKMTELIARARAQQDRDVTQARITFYRLLDSDDYDYLALEKTLTEGIEQLTSAERQDLAVLLAADLKVLRDRQATRAGAAQRKERDAMQDRIRKLEDQLHQEQQNDADQRITIYDQPYLWPVYINRPVYVPSEPCPAPVPSPWHQAFRPPTPAQPVAVPYSPRVTPLPVARPVPTPVCPAPAYQPDKPAPRTAWTPAAAAARPAPIIPAATRSPHTRGPVNIRR